MTSTSTASFCFLRRHPLWRALALLLFATLLLQSADAEAPQWWTTQHVLHSGAAADDYAVANVGQLKTIARKAAQEMDTVLPDGAGTGITPMISAWEAVADPGVTRDDYAVLTLGQLKTVAKKFYDRLGIVNSSTPTYPWTGTAADDYAPANLGQLKTVFAFAIHGIPDSWKTQMFGNNTSLDSSAAGDPDGDGVSNYDEWQQGTNPLVKDSRALRLEVHVLISP